MCKICKKIMLARGRSNSPMGQDSNILSKIDTALWGLMYVSHSSPARPVDTNCSRVNRRVVFLLCELSFPLNHRAQTLPCIILAIVLYLPTRECHTSACSHEQGRNSKTEVSVHNQELTNTIPCHSTQKGSTTVPTTPTIVSATTAPPQANGKRLQTTQSRTDCSITPSWERNRTSSLISPAITYHHANLNYQEHTYGKKPVTCILGSSIETTSKPTEQTGSYQNSASRRASSHYQVA